MYDVLRLCPDDSMESTPDAFSVYLPLAIQKTLKQTGITDLPKHFVGSEIEIEGTVSAISHESTKLPTTFWTYHIELRSPEQFLRVDSQSAGTK